MKFIKPILLSTFILAAGCSGTGGQNKSPVWPDEPRATVIKPTAPKPDDVVVKKSLPPEPAIKITPLEPSAPPAWATPSKKVEASSLSSVALAMISDADRSAGSGNLESAASALERGLRIEPRNATLLYKLADIRLKQSQPKLAEDLAKKSALLAASDTVLKKRCWLLIAEARKKQGDTFGADEALRKASQF